MQVSTRLQQQVGGLHRIVRTPVIVRAAKYTQQKPYRASRRMSLTVSANFIFNALNQGKIALAVSQAGKTNVQALRENFHASHITAGASIASTLHT